MIGKLLRAFFAAAMVTLALAGSAGAATITNFSLPNGPLGGPDVQFLGNLHDHLAQLQLSVPPSRNRRSTILNTQQVPGDQPGAVAIATVIHRCDHALFERARCQGAP